jgi:hypothetical protein
MVFSTWPPENFLSGQKFVLLIIQSEPKLQGLSQQSFEKKGRNFEVVFDVAQRAVWGRTRRMALCDGRRRVR